MPKPRPSTTYTVGLGDLVATDELKLDDVVMYVKETGDAPVELRRGTVGVVTRINQARRGNVGGSVEIRWSHGRIESSEFLCYDRIDFQSEFVLLGRDRERINSSAEGRLVHEKLQILEWADAYLHPPNTAQITESQDLERPVRKLGRRLPQETPDAG